MSEAVDKVVQTAKLKTHTESRKTSLVGAAGFQSTKLFMDIKCTRVVFTITERRRGYSAAERNIFLIKYCEVGILIGRNSMSSLFRAHDTSSLAHVHEMAACKSLFDSSDRIVTYC